MELVLSNESIINDVAKALMSLNGSEEPVVIREGRSFMTPSQWQSFLSGACGLTIDKRHYSITEEIGLADWWEISYQPDKANAYAHSKTKQPFHTDNAWFSDPAAVNFFIMEKQAISGGEQFIYRLSRLLEDLSKDDPSLFHDLCNTVVTIKKGDGKYSNTTTIIKNGQKPEIFWNYYRTEKSNPFVISLCDRFFKFLETKEFSSSIETIDSKSGDCFAFNDTKMLHARNSFVAEKPFDRVLLQSMWNFR